VISTVDLRRQIVRTVVVDQRNCLL
jgi:hypothetical protein